MQRFDSEVHSSSTISVLLLGEVGTSGRVFFVVADRSLKRLGIVVMHTFLSRQFVTTLSTMQRAMAVGNASLLTDHCNRHFKSIVTNCRVVEGIRRCTRSGCSVPRELPVEGFPYSTIILAWMVNPSKLLPHFATLLDTMHAIRQCFCDNLD